MMLYQYPSVLSIAGSDSGGGAGIQADLKTFSALGCFGTSAITAITVQNTRGVSGIHSIPAAIVKGQIIAVMDDIKPAAIKIGMVHSIEMAVSISEALKSYKDTPVVFDPVMVATSGDKLIKEDTVSVFKNTLFPLATLITPNLDEAELLCGKAISNLKEMQAAAITLLDTGCSAVLLKGGHLNGKTLYDVFVSANGEELIFESDHINSENVHGTGCTLSSAIAAYLAQGEDLTQAIDHARTYVHQAILAGKDVKTGHGHGPLNHFFNPKKLTLHSLS